VRLAYETGYATLLEDIAAFVRTGEAGAAEADGGGGRQGAGEAPSREQVRRWHSGFYLPACALLSDSLLSRRFPGAQPGDLFVTVARFYRDLLGGYPPGASYETLLSGFRFARRLPERRPLRAAPFRLLLAVLGLRRP
jgi:hypothetical protein